MKKHAFSILTFISIITLISCNGKAKVKVTHDDEVNYYVTIWTVKEHTTGSWNNFINAYNNAYNLSTWNDSGTVPPGRVDTLENLLKVHVVGIDSSVNKISLLKELDNELNIIQLMLDYLDQSKTLCAGGMHDMVETFRTGNANLTDMQKMTMESFDKDAEKIRGDGSRINDRLQTFAERHKVSSDELRKYKLK